MNAVTRKSDSEIATVKLLINGEFVESRSTEWRDIVNPATQEVLARVPIPVPVPYFSFTGSRGSKLGDLGPYGKQVVQFYTQTKTVTARWFDDAIVNDGVNTTISLR
jgi:acyl-CoA reductase-like NAD-dependent aldehyde dehydrogenase